MSTATLNITDIDLLSKIRFSFLENNQKNELEELLPEMTTGERSELVDLLEQVETETSKILEHDEEYQSELSELNEKYIKKLDHLVKEESENARKEFESIDKKEGDIELKELEKEINATDAAITQNEASKEAQLKQVDSITGKHKHIHLKILLAIGALGAVATGILYLLNYF